MFVYCLSILVFVFFLILVYLESGSTCSPPALQGKRLGYFSVSLRGQSSSSSLLSADNNWMMTQGLTPASSRPSIRTRGLTATSQRAAFLFLVLFILGVKGDPLHLLEASMISNRHLPCIMVSGALSISSARKSRLEDLSKSSLHFIPWSIPQGVTGKSGRAGNEKFSSQVKELR